MTVSSVFHKPDALPSAQRQLSVCNGNVQRSSTQHAFDVCWHIVGALAVVLIQPLAFRDQPVESVLHILLNSWIIIFTECQSRRSMGQKYITEADLYTLQLFTDGVEYLVCDEIASPLSRLQLKVFLEPNSGHCIRISWADYNYSWQAVLRRMSYYTRKLVIGVTGILTATMATSYLVEKIFNQKYRAEGTNKSDMFIYPSLVTWMGCLFCSLYGLIYAAIWDKKPNQITFTERFRLGLLFTLNYLPTNYALLYISYPLQVITKNTRYLLVVIVGVYFSRVQKSKELKLPKSKVLIATVISLGAGLFMYFDSNKSSEENHFHPEKKWIGLLLLLLAIVCDAMFSDSQAYCKSVFQPSQNQLFLAANLYGFMLIFLFAILSGQLAPSLKFLMRHPQIQKDIVLIASLQVVSQISVYYVISNFKQHIYPLISTVRKLLTILFSIFIFKHQLSFYQWVAIAIVFVAMGFELYDEVQSQEQNRQVRKQRIRQSQIEQEQEVKEVFLEENSQIKENKDKQWRPNSFLSPGSRIAGGRNESNSKYGYGWRRDQVVQNRQSSLSPDKNK